MTGSAGAPEFWRELCHDMEEDGGHKTERRKAPKTVVKVPEEPK